MKLSILLIVLLLVAMPIAFAQEVSEEILDIEAGMTPDSPFYGFKRFGENVQLWFTFNNLEKAKLKYKLAQVRLKEAELMAEMNKLQLAERAVEEYLSGIEETDVDAEQLSIAGTNISSLAENVNNATYKHMLVLNKLREKLPEKAKAKIETIIERSLERQQNIVAKRISNMEMMNMTIEIGNKTITKQVPAEFADKFLENADKIKKTLREKIKIMNREETEERIGELVEIGKNRAEEKLNEAIKELEQLKTMAASGNYSNTTAISSLLRNAERHIENANTAMNNNNYGNAFGQAVSAGALIRNTERIMNRVVTRADKVNEKLCIQMITPAVSSAGECIEFSTPCDVPEGWKKVNSCHVANNTASKINIENNNKNNSLTGNNIKKMVSAVNNI